MNKIKLVALDLDGVLVDAVKIHQDAFINAVNEITNILISNQFHENHLNGLPTKKKLKVLADIPLSLHDKISERKQELTIDLIDKKLKADAIKIELLSKLKAGDFKTACVTNSIRKTAKLMLDRVGIWPYIDLLVSNEDVNQPKPNSEPYFRAMTYFDLPAAECLGVEDTDIGATSVLKAGIKLWKVNGPAEVNWLNIQEYLGDQN